MSVCFDYSVVLSQGQHYYRRLYISFVVVVPFLLFLLLLLPTLMLVQVLRTRDQPSATMSVSAAAPSAALAGIRGPTLSPNFFFLQGTRTTRLQSGISLKSEKAKEIEANKNMASAVPTATKPTKKKPNNAKATAKAPTSLPSFPNLPGGSVAINATSSSASNKVHPNSKAKRTTSGARSTKRKESPENEDDEATEIQKKAKGPRSSKATKTNKDPPFRKGKSAKDNNEDKKTKPPSRKRKSTEDDDEDETTENDAHPAKKARIPKALAPTKTKSHRLTKPKVVINQAPTEALDVYVFGEGSSGELGLGTAKNAIDVKRPRLNALLSAQKVGVTQIACGGMHVAAVTKDNKVLTWGVNDQGALGRDTTWDGGLRDIDDAESDASDSSNNGLNPKESTPTPLPDNSFPEGTVIIKVSAGDSHTLALTDDGLVYGWGTYRVSATPTTALSSHVWLIRHLIGN